MLINNNLINQHSDKSEISPNNKYSIKSNVLDFYGRIIDDSLINLIIEHNINTIRIHTKLSHSIDNLPNNISVLILDSCDSSQLYDLPNSITHLYFLHFTGELNCLSNGIKVIDFSNYFNNEIKNLPNSTEEIITGNEFNKSVDYLPNNLKIIKFGIKFNKSVDNLPFGLERIIFGIDFNQSIDNLPDSVNYIVFDWVCVFSQPIYKLPINLEEIYFNSSFSNDICELPEGLKKILLGTDFSKPIVLPNKLEKIKLCGKYKYLNIINKMTKNKNIIKELYNLVL